MVGEECGRKKAQGRLPLRKWRLRLPVALACPSRPYYLLHTNIHTVHFCGEYIVANTEVYLALFLASIQATLVTDLGKPLSNHKILANPVMHIRYAMSQALGSFFSGKVRSPITSRGRDSTLQTDHRIRFVPVLPIGQNFSSRMFRYA